MTASAFTIALRATTTSFGSALSAPWRFSRSRPAWAGRSIARPLRSQPCAGVALGVGCTASVKNTGGGRRWVGHPFPEEPDQTRWRDRIGLAGDRLGLGVDEAHVVEPRVHAADRIGDAAGEVDAFDDGPGRGMERRVEPWGEWSALFFVESGFSAALFVLKKSVFLSIAESLEPVADGWRVEEHDFGNVG